MAHVLIVSLPRSGSTWLARMLSEAAGVELCEEPDNHWKVPYAFRAKRSLPGRFHPLLDEGYSAGDYETLWRSAFGWGERDSAPPSVRERIRERSAVAALRLFDRGSDAERSRASFMRHMRPGRLPLHLRASEILAVARRPRSEAQHVVVKSVYGLLATEWIAARFPVAVVVLLRNPFAVISSWHERGWLGEPGDEMVNELDPAARDTLSQATGISLSPSSTSSSGVFTSAAQFYAMLTRHILDRAAGHPDWKVVRHETLAGGAPDSLRDLAGSVGLPWSAKSDSTLASLDRPGRGFDTLRTREQLSESWRQRLTPEQLAEVGSALERAGIEDYG